MSSTHHILFHSRKLLKENHLFQWVSVRKSILSTIASTGSGTVQILSKYLYLLIFLPSYVGKVFNVLQINTSVSYTIKNKKRNSVGGGIISLVRY